MNDLIFDRVWEDVENKTPKGYYNTSDMNRVEEWCNYLSEIEHNMGYDDFYPITTKTNWAYTDLRSASEMTRIRQNIIKIIVVFNLIRSVATITEFNYLKANNWEECLYDMWNLSINTRNWYVYGGVARGGQNRVWQHRFRQRVGYTYHKTWRDLQRSNVGRANRHVGRLLIGG